MGCDCFCHRLGSCVVSTRAKTCKAFKTFETGPMNCSICIEGDAAYRKRSNVIIRKIPGSLDEVL